MPARADHHEPALAEPETGGVLVPMLVRLRLAGKFIRGEMMVRIGLWAAPQAVLDADLYPCVGDHVLDAGARHHAGSEGMALDDDRIFGQHGLDVQRLELKTIDDIEIGEAAVGVAEETMAELVLAAGVEAQIPAHLRPMRFQ